MILIRCPPGIFFFLCILFHSPYYSSTPVLVNSHCWSNALCLNKLHMAYAPPVTCRINTWVTFFRGLFVYMHMRVCLCVFMHTFGLRIPSQKKKKKKKKKKKTPLNFFFWAAWKIWREGRKTEERRERKEDLDLQGKKGVMATKFARAFAQYDL